MNGTARLAIAGLVGCMASGAHADPSDFVVGLGPAVGPISPGYTYRWDDGSPEWYAGLRPGGVEYNAAFMNGFEVVNGYRRIEAVEVYYNTDGGSWNVGAGVWADPNQDGDPADAVLLGMSTTVVASAGWQSIALPSVVDVGPLGTSFFVGTFMAPGPSLFNLNIGLDTDFAEGYSVSYAADADNPSALQGIFEWNNLGLGDVALMIRGRAQLPAPGASMLLGVSGILAARRRR